ncbi:MAG: hypothetical protein SOW56_06370 [Bacteroidaceae bacterium]|nr:hypothetical protein [Prevotellaceae bacterium]MDY3063634.1 hypothetical protein [Bacteroidaceae bacterium]
MGILSRIFKKKNAEQSYRIGGMEDFMSLIRVYYQAVMASRLGITNLAMLPDLRVFKSTLHVATVNNKLGLGEKNRCKKMLQEIYGLEENFFGEIDASIKANCRNINQVNNYFLLFQGFSQDLLTVLSTTLQLRLRMPSFFKKALRAIVEKGVNDIFNKDNFKDDAVRKAAYSLRTYKQRLGYSKEWMVEYAYHIIILAKKEPRNKNADEVKK